MLETSSEPAASYASANGAGTPRAKVVNAPVAGFTRRIRFRVPRSATNTAPSGVGSTPAGLSSA